jgi:Spy/CpxP family protein refolding chaperone
MKNISKLIPSVAAMAFLLLAFSAPVSAGRGVNAGQQGWRPWCTGNLSAEDQAVLGKERQAFFDDTQDLRQDMVQKRLELQSELAKKNPDDQKAAALQNDISKLTQEFDQKRLDFILKMKKTIPDIGRIGSGMMEPGYGWGRGTMRRAPAQGEFGPASSRLERPLKEDGARTVVENYLQSTRNPNLKLGKITEQGDAFEAEIVTKEGSLVDKLLIEKSTGWMHPNRQISSNTMEKE